MKKKSIILVSLLVVLGFLGFMATNLVRNSGKSDTELLEFSLADTSSIDKIIITEPNGMKFELIRTENNWSDSEGNCVIHEPVISLLEAFKNVEFKGYVPENARKNILRRMMALNTKVEIFQNGSWKKTWYIGSSTRDHYGTYMLLETPDEKSDLPVIMQIKGLHGMIGPRFFADARRWMCTGIFALEKEDIAEVDVNFVEDNSRSFNIKRKKSTYEVKHNGNPIAFDTNMVVRYLNNYKKIHFELANFELNKKQIDSLKKAKPFCVLSLKQTNGQKDAYKMYRLRGNGDVDINDWGDTVSYDINRFWCLLPSGNFVKCQYFVFNPLIMGHIYFATKPEETNGSK